MTNEQRPAVNQLTDDFEAEIALAVRRAAALRQAEADSANQFVFGRMVREQQQYLQPGYDNINLIMTAVGSILRENIRQSKEPLLQYNGPIGPSLKSPEKSFTTWYYETA